MGTSSNVDAAARRARAAAWAVLGVAALYTFVRAWRLTLDYYDGFDYLHNASRLLREPVGAAIDDRRPMLLSVLQVPVVALCRRLGPGNAWLLRGPHLLNALLSMGSAAALVVLLRRWYSTTLALLGGVLFVCGRAFVHYGAHVMTDLAVTGLCAATLALHFEAVRTRKLGAFVLAGVVFGLAVAMKFSAPNLVFAILAAEAISLFDVAPAGAPGPRVRLNLDPWRRVGLAIEGLATVAAFAAVQLGSFSRLYGSGAWTVFREASASLSDVHWSLAGESWRDNLPMLIVILSWPVVILAAAGALVAVVGPRRGDVPFAAWLIAMGGALVFLHGHNETRYLFPVVPAVIYFALRGVEAVLDLGRRAGPVGVRTAAGVVGLFVAVALAAGVAQAGEDADPAFTADVHGRAARAMAERPPGEPPYAVGVFTTLAPATPGPLVEDEFWNAFHASPFQFSYLLGEEAKAFPAPNAPAANDRDALFPRLPDGARVLRFAGTYFETRGFPKGPHNQALEVWTVRRRELDLAQLRADHGRATLVSAPAGGPWWIYTKTARRPWAFAGASDTGDFGLPDAADVDGLALVRVDVERFE